MVSVLLVEPHEDTRELYAEFLQAVGFRVHAVATTNEACAAPLPDVVVTGLHVPGSVDGLGLIRRLRQRPESEWVAIIVLTASAGPATQQEATAAGCDVFLTKPCLPIDLATEIRHAGMQRSGKRVMLKAKADRRHYRAGAER